MSSIKNYIWNRIRRNLGIEGIIDDIQYLKLELGRENNLLQGNSVDNHEFKVFSQWGEDGIIQWLIHNIDISSRRFIEFGVQNYTESNTRFLLMNDNWSGLVIDGDKCSIDYIKNDDIYWRYNLKAKQAFITAENINDLIREEFGNDSNVGILSVDIDGNDYWVWKAIECVRADIVICEYNSRFGSEQAVTVPYNPDFIRNIAHYSGIYYGASLAALAHLAEKKGYSLVAGNSNGNNVFFVRNELLNDVVAAKTVSDVYVKSQFRESRDEKGMLSFLDFDQELKLLSQLPLVDVSND